MRFLWPDFCNSLVVKLIQIQNSIDFPGDILYTVCSMKSVLKTWVLTVERDGKLCRVVVEALTKRLAVVNYRRDHRNVGRIRHEKSDVILSVTARK